MYVPVDRSVIARQPVSHRRLSPSSVLIYAVLNRQSSGRGGRANCFDRLPLPATFEVADDCLALVTRLFFPGPRNAVLTSCPCPLPINDKSSREEKEDGRKQENTETCF